MTPNHPITIHSIYVGQPQTIEDAHGSYHSSIMRTRVDGPVQATLQGLAGDKVTYEGHGGPEADICCHSIEHYHFWKERYGLELTPGIAGENWTLMNADEAGLYIGDVFRVGGIRVQVTCPRVPCGTLARRVGRKDFADLTKKELRTGFFLDVLQEGSVQTGDTWVLEERPNPGLSIQSINRCAYIEFDREVAARFVALPQPPEYWKKKFIPKLG
jgi:MOSC domain-containing protein YiiM